MERSHLSPTSLLLTDVDIWSHRRTKIPRAFFLIADRGDSGLMLEIQLERAEGNGQAIVIDFADTDEIPAGGQQS
jgi:hypothetical protein